MATTTIGGRTIHLDVHGDGPDVLLMHGWGTTARHSWHDTGWVDALARSWRVITFDVRGHGRSEGSHDPADYTYAAMADDALGVLDAVESHAAAVVGHSLGAFSLLHLVGHEPDRLTAAVLLGIGDETPESIAVADAIAAGLRADPPDAIADPVGQAVRRWVDGQGHTDLEALAVAALAMWPDGFPRRIGGPGLTDTPVPVLVANGDDDDPYVRSDRQLVAAIAGARLLRVPDCDHIGEITHPDLRAEVLSFLDRHGRR